MFSEYIKESKDFGKKEDNPIIYTLVIAKLVKTDKEELKKDKDFKELINKAEKLVDKVNAKALKDSYNPISMFQLFNEENTKKALQEYVKQYFHEFETITAQSENTFDNAYKVHSLFKEFIESEEFINFLKSI